MSANHGPMQSSLAVAAMRCQIHGLFDQELNYVARTVCTREQESFLQLLFGRAGFQATVLAEEAFNDVEPAKRSCFRQVEGCAAAGKELGSREASVCQAAAHNRLPVARNGSL